MIKDDPHYAMWVECRLCGHRHVSVWPEKMVGGEENQECPNCGNMTCAPVEDEE